MQYRPILLKAQRKFRRELKKDSRSIQFLEAQRTGGQFSFRNLKTESDVPQFFSELFRINTYLNNEMMDSQKFVNSAFERGAPYAELFQGKEYLGSELTDSQLAEMYRAYRMLEEEDPAAIMRGGIFDSDAFRAYLYSYAVQGKSGEELRILGHNLIKNIREASTQWDEEIPVSIEKHNRRGHYAR